MPSQPTFFRSSRQSSVKTLVESIVQAVFRHGLLRRYGAFSVTVECGKYPCRPKAVCHQRALIEMFLRALQTSVQEDVLLEPRKPAS